MEIKLLEIKAAITGTVAALAMFLGWKGKLLIAWIALMVLDYITGSVAAKLTGSWASGKAREGIGHKYGMIAVVIGAFLADMVLSVACTMFPQLGYDWPLVIAPVMLIWYCLTEIGSIMENAEKLGAPVPKWLTAGLKIGVKVVEDYVGKFEKQNE